MFDSAAIIALVGVLASAIGGLIWVLKYVFTSLKPVMDQVLINTKTNTAATKANTEAALQAATASKEAAKVSATAVQASQEAVRVSKHADEYLRHRNGRDNEMHTELIAGVKEIPNAMNLIAKKQLESITALIESSKNVTEQHVDKQIVEKREVKT